MTFSAIREVFSIAAQNGMPYLYILTDYLAYTLKKDIEKIMRNKLTFAKKNDKMLPHYQK